jgi:hypothetical protein
VSAQSSTGPAPFRYLAIGVIGVLGLAASFAIAADRLPLREITVGLFLGLGPGLAVTWLVGMTDRAARLALVVPISLAVDLLVVSIVLYLGIWSPELVMVVIVGLTLVGLALAPYERPARAALIVVALLPCLMILAGELFVEPLSRVIVTAGVV